MRFFLSLIFSATALMAFADAGIDALISKGNRAYELGQREVIRECIDSIMNDPEFSKADRDERVEDMVSLLKLEGNYYYEYGSQDARAFQLAEEAYDGACELIDNNPNTSFRSDMKTLLLREKAQLYYRLGRYIEAVEALREADDRMEYTYQNVGDDTWLLTKMSLAIALARTGAFDEALRIARTELDNAQDKKGAAYTKAQRMYAKILLLADVNLKGALKAYKEYFRKQKQYAVDNFSRMTGSEREQYWLMLRPFIADCYSLEEADPGFLYDVTLFSKGLLLQISRHSGDGVVSADALRTLDYTWKDIRGRLKKRQTAVEFIEYEKGGEQRMAALVLKQGGKPVFVPLTSPSEILSIAGEAMRSTDRKDKDDLYRDGRLQSLVWTPALLKALEGADRVYFAPDGYMHRLAMEYMPQVDGKEMYRLTSTRRLMEKKECLEPRMAMLLCGGISYEMNRDSDNRGDNDSVAYYNYRGAYFPRLDAFNDESIKLHSYRENPADTLLSGSFASEQRFRELAGKYPSILVSTHGDFYAKELPVPNDLKPVESAQTMSQNVIAFAGANRTLKRSDFPASSERDGILSALELSEMDLSGCELFAVSACQTALGYITSDGVFGLQRGLKNAGVKAMLLSLWSVNSRATSLLMSNFYYYIGQNMSPHKALAEARKMFAVSKNNDKVEESTYVFDPAIMALVVDEQDEMDYNSPQFTDAFILIDAID